jgi:glutamine cyclotransferase
MQRKINLPFKFYASIYFLSKNSYKLILGLVLLSACSTTNNNTAENNASDAIAAPIPLQYEIVSIQKHDTSAYTQGLEWDGNRLIEGTGNYGKSILHILDSNMNSIQKVNKLDKTDFGEGTTLFKGKIYQLTWKEHKVLVYDAATLSKIKELYWPYEGWGLTHNDSSLIVSTGESNIYIVNPENFSIQRTIGVYNNYGYVSNINELELVDGKLFANIYGQNEIIVIDLNSGQVKNTIDFSNLLAKAGVKYDPLSVDAGYVLNGIAYNKNKKTFFITGKCWPIMAEVIIK